MQLSINIVTFVKIHMMINSLAKMSITQNAITTLAVESLIPYLFLLQVATINLTFISTFLIMYLYYEFIIFLQSTKKEYDLAFN